MSCTRAAQIREDLARHFTDAGTAGTFVGYKIDDYLVIASDKDALGRGQAAGLDLQGSEFGDRAGDRRCRRSRQGRLQMGRRRQIIEAWNKDHTMRSAIPVFRGARLSGDCAARRRGADAEICRSVRIWQPRYRRRHRPVWLTGNLAYRSGPAGRFRRPAAARHCRSRSAARIWCGFLSLTSWAIHHPRQVGAVAAPNGKPSLGWMVGWAEKGSANTVFALNLDVSDPRHIPDRMKLTQQCLADIGAISIRDPAGAENLAGLASARYQRNAGGNHEICHLDGVADGRRGRRLARRHHVPAARDRQGTALSAIHHGSAQRRAKAARRADR